MQTQKRKVLAVASTSYHLMVFLFIKDAFLKDAQVDLVLTDKSAYLYELYQSGRTDRYFHHTFFADAKKIKNPYKSALVNLWESFVYNPTVKAMLTEKDYPAFTTYDDLYFASPGVPDEIVKELIKTCIRQNKKLRLHRFEDGFASYTKPPVSSISTGLGRYLYRAIWGYDIRRQEQELYLFEPSLAEKNVADSAATGFTLKQIPKTPERIALVTEQIRYILQFQSRRFPQEYLFLGQGTANGMQNPDTYQSLVYEIAAHVGTEQFLVKPHPRGQYDAFDDTISVYSDTCPFELAVADGTMEDKTLLSYYSTACVSGKLLFNSRCRIIFLYPLAGDSFNEKCDYEDYFHTLCSLYDNIYIAHTKEELWKLLS